MKKASMISTMHQTEVQKLDQYFFHAAHEWMGKKPSKAIVLVKKRWKFQLFNRFLAEMFDVIKILKNEAKFLILICVFHFLPFFLDRYRIFLYFLSRERVFFLMS